MRLTRNIDFHFTHICNIITRIPVFYPFSREIILILKNNSILRKSNIYLSHTKLCEVAVWLCIFVPPSWRQHHIGFHFRMYIPTCIMWVCSCRRFLCFHKWVLVASFASLKALILANEKRTARCYKFNCTCAHKNILQTYHTTILYFSIISLYPKKFGP